MQIDLTPEQQDFVRQAVAIGRFERPKDAVQAALALWIEREPAGAGRTQQHLELYRQGGRAHG